MRERYTSEKKAGFSCFCSAFAAGTGVTHTYSNVTESHLRVPTASTTLSSVSLSLL